MATDPYPVDKFKGELTGEFAPSLHGFGESGPNLITDPIIRTGKAGTGTYGVVYVAELGINNEKKTLVVKRNIVDDTADFTGSIKEMNLLVRLRTHPHIVKLESVSFGNPFSTPLSPIHEDGLKEDYIHFVFEKATLDGSRLLLKVAHRTLTMLALKTIFGQILLGLEYIHAHHILHRDLKPANILWFSGTNTVKLCDFGLSKIGCSQGLSTPRAVTSWYRAPEIILGYPQYTEKVDIWSVGCIFFEFMTGRPFLQHSCEDNYSLLSKMISQLPYLLSESTLNELYKYRKQDSSGRSKEVRSKKRRTPEEEIRDLAIISTNVIKNNKSWDKILNLSNTVLHQFNQPLNSKKPYDEFLDLLNQLLQFDPKYRISATQALDHPFFDFMRDEIQKCRSEHPPVPPPSPLILILNTSDRKYVMNVVSTIFNNREHLSWYRHRMLFQAIDLYDRYLVYLSRDLNQEINKGEKEINELIRRFIEGYNQNNRLMPSSPLRNDLSVTVPTSATQYLNQLRFMVCLYVSIKFFLNLSIIPTFSSIVTDEFCNDEALYLAGEMEHQLIRYVCKLEIYRETLYEACDYFEDYLPLTEEKVRDLLVYYMTLPSTSGLTVRELLKFHLIKHGRSVSPIKISCSEPQESESRISLLYPSSGPGVPPKLKIVSRVDYYQN